MRLYSRGIHPINRLFKADKGFIGGFDDTWSFTSSVDSHPLRKEDLSKKHPNEVVGYGWHGGLNLNVRNTRIRLHDPVNDEGLFKLEKKLTLLRDKLQHYVNLIKERHDKKDEPIYHDRCWLNPLEWESDYTGYVSVFIASDGHTRLSIADCHRVISIWIDAPSHDHDAEEDAPPTLDKFSEENIGLLLAIVGVVGKSIDQIDLLRAGFTKTLAQSRELTK